MTNKQKKLNQILENFLKELKELTNNPNEIVATIKSLAIVTELENLNELENLIIKKLKEHEERIEALELKLKMLEIWAKGVKHEN